MIIRLYAALLHLYPRRFRAEFGEEMMAVFEETLSSSSSLHTGISIFLHELRDLPGNLIDVYLNTWFKGDNMYSHEAYISPSTRWQASIGALPFLAFGISSMISKVDHLPIRGQDVEMVVYGLSLVGLLIGWIQGFPLWSYSYLGWSILIAYFNTNWGYYGDPDFQVWIPFGITVLIAILWTHSFAPIKKFFQDIWNDWTRLSLAMFAFGGFVWLIYDENHHPQLLWFILAATLAISAGVWFFLRSSSLKGRVFSIIFSWIVGDILSRICYATWDYRAYYGLPEATRTRTWYQSLGITVSIFTFYLAILFWPVLIGLIHRIVNHRSV
jgi:hypothetical protein